MLSREQLIAKADELPQKPVAVEAWWNGDTDGWFVVLVAVYAERRWFRSKYREMTLGCLRGDGGDLRLFNGEVPPWPEAWLASEVGQEIASRFGIPFYFPSPRHPEEDCPRWWDRDRGVPCRRCGIPLLQRAECRWPGVCYCCHLEEEREKKEAAWTPEERAGPRCHICGNPAKGTLCSSPACLDCLERYEEYQCAGCGLTVRILKTEEHTDVCSDCDLRARLAQVSEPDRRAIRTATEEGGMLAGVDAVRERLDWSLHDAMSAVRELSQSAEPGDATNGGRDAGA